MDRPALNLGLILAAATLGGCSGFESAWRAASADAAAERTGPVLGRWEGQWRSGVNDHHGALRCIVRRAEGESGAERQDGAQRPAQYEFIFEGVWGWNIKSRYRISATVERRGDGWHFTGARDLGWKFGRYESEGVIRNGQFNATWTAAGDHGVFEMRRPPP